MKFRYVGYRDKSITLDPASLPSGMVVAMSAEPYEVAEVVIRPTENPAHRIIRLAAENRNKNNPEKSGPFSYISYDKMIFGLEPDTIASSKPGRFLTGHAL